MVKLASDWKHIEPLRTYVEACLSIGNERIAGRATIVLHELLENAVKYGDPAAQVEVEVEMFGASAVVLRVTNRAHKSRLAVLRKEYDRASGSGDSAQQAFSRALDRLKKLPVGSSMLGLARMTMESKLSLDLREDSVQITATIE